MHLKGQHRQFQIDIKNLTLSSSAICLSPLRNIREKICWYVSSKAKEELGFIIKNFQCYDFKNPYGDFQIFQSVACNDVLNVVCIS